MRKEGACARQASLLRSLCAGILGFILCCGLLLIVAVTLERGLLPEGTAQLSVYGAVMISVILTAVFAAGSGGRRVLGSLAAGVVFLLFSGACGFALGGVISSGRVFILCGVVLVSSAAGALLSGLWG